MTAIDPEKLEEAIKGARHPLAFQSNLTGLSAVATISLEHLRALAAAAEVTLSTLPRVKEVEIERWAVVMTGGRVWDIYDDRDDAENSIAARRDDGDVIIRLTGTGKVRA